MYCALCGGKVVVKDSVQSKSTKGIMLTRIRICVECKNRIITMENIPDVVMDTSYKHNGINANGKQEIR